MKNYDIAVIGGGTAGCAAAYIAGKLGLKTLLIEKNIHLGGSITSGLVIPAMFSSENQINTEFFDDLILEMKSVNGQVTYQNNKGWFNPELMKIVLDKMMKKFNVDVLYNTKVKKVNLHDNKIKSIEIYNNLLSEPIYKIQNGDKALFEPIETRYVIDSTGNCEIGKICNCKFLNKNDELQPINLRFIMENVNVKELANWLIEYDSDRDITSVEHIDGIVHLSTAYTWDSNRAWALKPLFDEAVKKGIIEDEDRNYFQIFTIAGMPSAVAFNCPRIIKNVDLYDNYSLSRALISAREAIYRLSDFCKKYLKGFENAYISNIADEVGIRVSDRIKGKYVYTIEDLKSGKKFDNPVLISNYPIDVHSSNKDSSTLQEVGTYELPIEALMSNDINNLFVAGRCLSADFMSQGALRIQPSCFSMGEGVSKYIKNNLI